MTIMNERPVIDAKFPEGICVGLPDGPYIFIPEFGMRVPSFIDPREDLIPKKAVAFKRLNYHVPQNLRGHYRINKLPKDLREHLKDSIRTDDDGWVICGAKKKNGDDCPNRASNLAGVCNMHGAALHPCDKILVADTPAGELAVKNNAERFEQLSRAEKFAGGLLPMADLSDEEITGGYILDEDGRKIVKHRFPKKLHQMMVKELHARMQDYMQMNAPSMLKRVRDIAMSDLAEPETSLKASIWLAERVIGKTPDIIIHGKTDSPYDSIIENMERVSSGSREDYRKGVSPDFVASQRIASEDNSILDVSVVDDSDEEELEDEDSTEETNDDLQQTGISARNDDSGTSQSHQRADSLVSQREQALALSKARKKAKQKRFVARLLGSGLDGDMPWPILWTRYEGDDGSVAYTGRPVCPDELTETMLAKIATAASDMDVN